MARGRKPSPQQKRVNVSAITCLSCGQSKKPTEFYASSSVFNAATGRVQYCKECCINLSTDGRDNIDIERLKSLLEKIDKPFLQDVLQSAYDEGTNANTNPLGIYFKNLNSLPQYRSLTWKDSILEQQHTQSIQKNDDFDVTDDIIEFFGTGYTTDEYRAMYRKYNFLKNNYPEKTNMHIEALTSYVRFKVKEEFAIAAGDVGAAGKWADLANKAATAAKINPSQLSAADLQDGLSTFGQLARAVEQAVDIVEILPRFKQKPQDNVDFTLWCYINYVRGLKGLGDCEYKDIYGFYEQRKKDLVNKVIKNDIDEENEGDSNGIT
jgi:hypothetical protein